MTSSRRESRPMPSLPCLPNRTTAGSRRPFPPALCISVRRFARHRWALIIPWNLQRGEYKIFAQNIGTGLAVFIDTWEGSAVNRIDLEGRVAIVTGGARGI